MNPFDPTSELNPEPGLKPSLQPSDPTDRNLVTQLQAYLQTQPQARIPFLTFMDWVLYHPQGGYYSQGQGLGQRGDFFTSAHLGSDFGELLAIQGVESWHKLGKPNPFYWVEMGAGQGFFSTDFLKTIATDFPDCFECLQYLIIERSPGLMAQQKHHLEMALIPINPSILHHIHWKNWDDIADESIVGCFFSNELVDAFPVHQVITQNGKLQEVYVTWENDRWTEVYGECSTDRLHQYFQEQNLDLTAPPYPDGYRTEVNLEAQTWLVTVAQKLQQGYLITIDYGYKADRYYHPQRYQGTLQCYYQHRRHSNPYVYLGEQDITTHVNFSDLQRWGTNSGLKTLGWTKQALFLMALGLGDRFTALRDQPPVFSTLLQRRDALHQLIDPSGLGNFGVLIQGKGLSTEAEILQGLSQI